MLVVSIVSRYNIWIFATVLNNTMICLWAIVLLSVELASFVKPQYYFRTFAAVKGCVCGLYTTQIPIENVEILYHISLS